MQSGDQLAKNSNAYDLIHIQQHNALLHVLTIFYIITFLYVLY